MTTPDFEDELRAALHRRADAAGSHRRRPASPRAAQGAVWRLVAIGAAAAAVAGVTAFAVTTGGSRATQQVTATPDGEAGGAPDGATTSTTTTGSTTPPAGPRELPDAEVPRLGFDIEGFRYDRVDECGDLGEAAEWRARERRFQRFGRTTAEGPMLFLRTLNAVTDDFGLVTAESGDPFQARGTTGYASFDRGTARGWNLSVVLPDGRAIYAIVLGLELAEVVPVLDELTPRADGGWDAAVLPEGLQELAPSQQAETPRCYSASGDLPGDATGPFEVNLYPDPFDERLADRAASTRGAITAVQVDGFPASLGSYRPDDHWVMLEPEPGRTIELRAQGFTRDQVLDLVARARFVDEATWQELTPSG